MSIWKTILRLFTGETDDKAFTLDHVPIRARKVKKTKHERKLREASARHGKPFKAAGVGIAREVMVDGKLEVVDHHETAEVRPIKQGRKA